MNISLQEWNGIANLTFIFMVVAILMLCALKHFVSLFVGDSYNMMVAYKFWKTNDENLWVNLTNVDYIEFTEGETIYHMGQTYAKSPENDKEALEAFLKNDFMNRLPKPMKEIK